MDRLHLLQLFVRVVENGSFSLTAKEFSLSQATVSKQLSELERQIRAKLLARTTRRLHVTEAGEKFYERSKLILEQYQYAVGEVGNAEHKPAGTLRLASPILMGRKQITPLLPKFFELYPDVMVEHSLSDSATDLIREGIDLSIRLGEMKDSTHQARKLGVLKNVTVASPDFLKKHGAIKHPKDLSKLPCLIYLRHPTPYEWAYREKDKGEITVAVNGPYRVDVFEALCEAALAGMGVLRAPLSAVGDDIESGKLVNILADYNSTSTPIYAVMPASAYTPQKTRVMIDFLVDQFGRNPWLSDPAGG
jgi:DNA-binding transcriptional LysR family regulator